MNRSVRSISVLMLSGHVTQETGGPGVAAAGFANALALRGNKVCLLALDSQSGHWLVDENDETLPFQFRRVRGRSWFERRRSLVETAREALLSLGPAAIWVNGIWGVQSLAGAEVSKLTNAPLVIRPAGSLGHAALRYKPFRKRGYLQLVERPVLEQAIAIHCMTEREREELPRWLQLKAFVVPTGVDVRQETPEPASPVGLIVGVLGRLHRIKRQHLVLDAVEKLVGGGLDVRVELAGATNDEAYKRQLESRIHDSEVLRGRVEFLGHVEKDQIPNVVGRWRVAALLSEQENFGHAVVTAAALGVPTVVSNGVGLGKELEDGGAGRVADASRAAGPIRDVLSADRKEQAAKCRRFAEGYAWPRTAGALEEKLRGFLGRTRDQEV